MLHDPDSDASSPQATLLCARRALPARRSAETLDFSHDGIRYTLTVGFYPDGRPGEIFIDGPKAGSGAQVNATDAAVILSIAMQHGVPVETLRAAVSRNAAGEPTGPIGAVLDLLAVAS